MRRDTILQAHTMELSNILQAIGADDVKVTDWSTAEAMLDVIPIQFYRCRLCQNKFSSLKKSMMIQHLIVSHEAEWKMASVKVKELMNPTGRLQPSELPERGIHVRRMENVNVTYEESRNTQENLLDPLTEQHLPNTSTIGRLPTRINHPLFLASSLSERKAVHPKNTHSKPPGPPEMDGQDNGGIVSLQGGEDLSALDNDYFTRMNATNTVESHQQQPQLSWAGEWARQARMNYGMFNETAIPNQPVTPPKIHTCQHCPSRFTTKKALQKHQDIHNGVLVHCDLCDFTSVWNTSVKKHKQLKHFRENLPVLSCPQCDFKTKNSDNMRRHRKRIHTREALSVQTPRKISTATSLNSSTEASSPKFHTCEHCCKTFTTKRAMKKHQDIHNGTLVNCDLCDFTSVWSSSIKKHKLLRHFRENLPVLYCPQCDFKTKNSDNLRRHKRIIHRKDNPIACGLLQTDFTHPVVMKEPESNNEIGVNLSEDFSEKEPSKPPKLEQKDVYITSNAPVTQYFDVVNVRDRIYKFEGVSSVN